jgi:AraC-like DNA-binding protein
MPRLPKPATEPGPLFLLWPERVLFIGRLGALSMHRHAATACVVSLDGTLRVRTQPASARPDGRSALIAAGVMHAFDSGAQRVAVLYNDPHRPYYRALAARPPGAPTRLPPAAEARLIDALTALAGSADGGGPLPIAAFERTAADVLAAATDPGPDRRVVRVGELMRADLGRNRSLGELAAAVRLSPDRLQHLFLAEVGVPLRRFRMWLRFRDTLEAVAAGATITRAALDAGFASSSHFSHAFRATFGVAASRVFGASTQPRVVAAA